ncbi:MAG: ribosome biogenesis GTP-binding protein YihA/YsxC [Deltaproteobacteria bacterium]|jgi:GTP-binding protein|nr:ribosome biogenesis GTP-binding protein YihA/YsxC [Deltaproteobacteria bacterium]
MPEILPPALNAEFILGAVKSTKFPQPLDLELAFMGRSNCGKSSTLNRFVGRKSLARVSGTPGRTREINFFKVSWTKESSPFLIADLPGYGFAKVPKKMVESWEALVGSYLSAPRNQKAFLLVDSRRKITQDELMLLDSLDKLSIPTCVVATKSDKLSFSELSKTLALWKKELRSGVNTLAFSALTGRGRQELYNFALGDFLSQTK